VLLAQVRLLSNCAAFRDDPVRSAAIGEQAALIPVDAERGTDQPADLVEVRVRCRACKANCPRGDLSPNFGTSIDYSSGLRRNFRLRPVRGRGRQEKYRGALAWSASSQEARLCGNMSVHR
jgi:hypothetical protein